MEEPHRYTREEYLALEEQAGEKHEYWSGGQIVAMAGASYAHNVIKDNLAQALRQRLRTRGCTVVTSDQRVAVQDESGIHRYYYPDVVMVCGEPRFDDRRPESLLNPDLLVEVASPSSVGVDRTEKLDAYTQHLESLREYWVVMVEERHVVRHLRQENGWVVVHVMGPGSSIPFRDTDVPLDEVYAG